MNRRTRVALAVLLVIAAIGLALYRVPTTFNVHTRTQVISVTVGETHRDLWFFHDVGLYRGFDTAGTARQFSGSIRVLPGTTITLTRFGSGPLRVVCSTGRADAPVAELEAIGETAEIANGRLVIVHARPHANANGTDQPTVLPVNGTITVGAEVTDAISEYPVLLVEGSVTMLAHTLLGDMRYDAGRIALDLGDFIKLDQTGAAYGLVVAGAAPDLSATFRVVARSLRVYRFGAEGYSFYASPFTRVRNDPFIQTAWAAAVLIFARLLKPRASRERTSSDAPQ